MEAFPWIMNVRQDWESLAVGLANELEENLFTESASEVCFKIFTAEMGISVLASSEILFVGFHGLHLVITPTWYACDPASACTFS